MFHCERFGTTELEKEINKKLKIVKISVQF